MTCALYRHYDADGQLLYVGITVDPLGRTKAHETGADWADDVTYISVQRFPDKKSARVAEIEAILQEKPRHNKMSALPKGIDAVSYRVKVCRAQTGLSQQAYSKLIGVKRSILSVWEAGSQRLSLDGALAIRASQPGVTLDWLFLGEGEGPSGDAA